MKIPQRLSWICILVGWFSSGSDLQLFAQANAVPPQIPGPPPTQRGQHPDTQIKMQPTGLQATGGSIANSVYSNSIYGFQLKTPPGWVVVATQDTNPLHADSSDSVILKAAQVTRKLLVMTENAPLRKANQRKSLQILATHLVGQVTPTAARDYLAFSQKTAKEKSMPVEYLGDPEEVTINGQKFWKVASNESVDGVVQHVEQYVITRGAALLYFFIVSPDAAGLKELESTIQSLEFKELPQKPAAKRASRKPKADTSSKPQ